MQLPLADKFHRRWFYPVRNIGAQVYCFHIVGVYYDAKRVGKTVDRAFSGETGAFKRSTQLPGSLRGARLRVALPASGKRCRQDQGYE